MDDYSISAMSQKPSPLGMASPILILGIGVFILPYLNTIFHWKLPGWVSGLGIAIILIGAVHSVMIMNNR